jgi:pyrroline-5-carboxylate reductase
MKILIVGGGNMGRTYAASFVSNHSVARKDLFILEKAEDKRTYFLSLGFECVETSPGPFISEMNLVIFAVKPQDSQDLFEKISYFMKEDQLVLSIMAGVRIETLKEALPTTKIIRAMPNLPAQVGMGMTGFSADVSVSRTEVFSVQNLLNTTGKSLYFDDESLLDGVAAISGSGPAYVYYFMQAMIDSAIQMGFSTTEAETLVEQTFLGATHLLCNNNFTCREWIGKVSSKGGTTEAAIHSFESGHVSDQIQIGLQAALDRSIELGN